MRAIGEPKGKTPAQVALNWCVSLGWPGGCERGHGRCSHRSALGHGRLQLLAQPASQPPLPLPARVRARRVICKGALPIPGAKNRRQVEEISGALGWRLDEGEVAELEAQAAKVATPTGAPFENW